MVKTSYIEHIFKLVLNLSYIYYKSSMMIITITREGLK